MKLEEILGNNRDIVRVMYNGGQLEEYLRCNQVSESGAWHTRGTSATQTGENIFYVNAFFNWRE